VLSNQAEALAEAGIAAAAAALGVPAIAVPALIDLFKTIAAAPDAVAALNRAKQNALADAEDLAAVAAADAILAHGLPKI
jgi:hypothetical protein